MCWTKIALCYFSGSLIMFFSGETFIPFYTGRVIDILRGIYQQSEFLTALIFMGLYSLGRYVAVFSFHIYPLYVIFFVLT